MGQPAKQFEGTLSLNSCLKKIENVLYDNNTLFLRCNHAKCNGDITSRGT